MLRYSLKTHNNSLSLTYPLLVHLYYNSPLLVESCGRSSVSQQFLSEPDFIPIKVT